jgi:large subunit ribosomal protein L7Ae
MAQKKGKTAPKKGGAKPKAAPAPLVAQVSKNEEPTINPLFMNRRKNYRIGGSVQPKYRDMSRYVKWPKYIRLQRMKRILMERIRVPPSLNQFTNTLDKNQAGQLFRLLNKYRPLAKKERQAQLVEMAEAQANGTAATNKKRDELAFGMDRVCKLVESKRAKMVIMAHDCDPPELICWLPTVCRKLGVPYCIVKGKARLGILNHKRNATCCAVTSWRKEDEAEFETFMNSFMGMYNDNVSMRKSWGGGLLSKKSQAIVDAREAYRRAELEKKTGATI